MVFLSFDWACLCQIAEAMRRALKSRRTIRPSRNMFFSRDTSVANYAWWGTEQEWTRGQCNLWGPSREGAPVMVSKCTRSKFSNLSLPVSFILSIIQIQKESNQQQLISNETKSTFTDPGCSVWMELKLEEKWGLSYLDPCFLKTFLRQYTLTFYLHICAANVPFLFPAFQCRALHYSYFVALK